MDTLDSFKNMRVDSSISKNIEMKPVIKAKSKYDEQPQNLTIYYNIIEIIFVLVCPSCSWRKLRRKNILFRKAIEKLFFQLDVLNYIKHMQQLEILNYSILEPNENIIVQFLSKPSISLAQKKDVYDRIRSVTDINLSEANELYTAIKQLYDNKEKTNFQKRLFKLTKGEVGKLIRKMKLRDRGINV